MATEIGHFHTFQTSVTLTLDRVIWHTIVYHSSTSTYMPKLFTLFGNLFVDGQMNRRADGLMDVENGLLGRLEAAELTPSRRKN